MSKPEGRYPVSVWEKLREGLIVDLFLGSAAMALVGLVFRIPVFAEWGAYLAGALIVAFLVALALEFRADMRYDREHPLPVEEVSDAE